VASKLDRLLDSIHPSRTIEELGRRADDAINAFAGGSSQITDWNEFRSFVVRFHRHLEGRLLGVRGEMPAGSEAFNRGRCGQVLTHAYGPSGEKAAFELARTGNEGGLYGVLKKIAEILAEQYARNEVEARVLHYWNGLSVDEKLAAGNEYLDKYGHLLPSELTEGSGARVRADLPKALQEHPRLMQRLGQVGRT